jgi:GNAT superfamily N-acetyltransferase
VTLRVDVQFRARMAEDVPYITNSWILGCRRLAAYQSIPARVRDHHVHVSIERLWQDPGVVWLVAALPRDLNYVYGYLCGEASDQGPIVHHVHVRREMTGFGVATSLMEEFLRGQDRSRGWYTCDTPQGRGFLQRSTAFRRPTGEQYQWLYNPFLLWEREWRTGWKTR